MINAIGLTVLYDPGAPLLDIVFVHGLAGHPERTWTQKVRNIKEQNEDNIDGESAGPPLKIRGLNLPQTSYDKKDISHSVVYWPRDLVPMTAPHARVLTYGYDISLKHSLSTLTSDNTVHDIALDCLIGLEDVRRTGPSRPVLFIAHSLGGVVVKEVLRRSSSCYSSQPHLHRIFESTIGIMFFGTPHDSTDPHNFPLHVVERIIKAVRVSGNNQVVDTLLPPVERLQEPRDGFSSMAKEQNWMIFSFQEQLGIKVLGGFKVVDDALSFLNIPDLEVTQHIARSHIDMCRFTGLDDIEYKKIAAALHRIAKVVYKHARKEKVSFLSEEQRQMLIESLKFEEMEDRQMVIRSAHTKTCKWLLKKAEYLDWLDAAKLNEHYSFWWIKGKPGTGKSTIMKYALANSRKTMKDQIIISFFFNARGVNLEKSTIGMYRSLLSQLIEQAPELRYVFDSEFVRTDSNRNQKWNVELLKDLFNKAMQRLGKSSVTCYIDGLDECDTQDILMFFHHLEELSVSVGTRFRACFSSRHSPPTILSKGPDIALDHEEGHFQDITNYIDSELRIGHGKLAEQIKIELQKKSAGVFLWVVLVIEILNKEYNSGHLSMLPERLQKIPNNVQLSMLLERLQKIPNNVQDLLIDLQDILHDLQEVIKTQTDEGYFSATRSGTIKNAKEAEDSATIYSDFSDMSESKVDNCVSELAANLFSKLPHDSATLSRVASILADRLRDFALRVGYQAPTQMHLDVMVFIHRYRHNIAHSFSKNCSAYIEEKIEQPPISETMPLHELVETWRQRAEFDEKPSTDMPVDLEEYDLDESTATDFLAYRKLIFTSPVYQWLIAILQREFYMSPAEQDIMTQIRATVLQSLPPTHRLSRKKSPETYTVSFQINWDPLKFFEEQEYGISAEKVLPRVLTLTATSNGQVQCLPCLNYLRQMWPFTGDSFLKFISDVLRDPSTVNECRLPDNTLLTSLAFEAPNFVVIVNGTADSVGEIAEMFGWLVTALAPSPVDRGIIYYRPLISQLPKGQFSRELGNKDALSVDFCIGHEIQPLTNNPTQINGQCWHDLFHRSVVVYGYPILRRPQSQPGLEIPLNIMAALLEEERINTFEKRLYIKGFNAMLVPTKRLDGLLLWHLLLNKDESHLSYLNIKSIETDGTICLADLETHRHVVGWCSNATYYAGASDINYEIERSRLPKPQAGCVLEKCSISGGKFITAGLSFALGIRDKSVQLTRNGYIRRLEWISKKFVVFWDEGEKRGWLVNGTSALLHIVRASLEHNSRSKFKSAYIFSPEDLVEAPITHVPGSALDVLLDKKNRKLKIYDDAEEDSEDENEGPKNPSKLKPPLEGERTYYRFQDRVKEIFETLEKIIHYEISDGEESGTEIKFRARKYLEGWDFKDLATDNDPFYPRAATLDAYGKGWVDFTRSIHAITLFGKGFGDIIKPTASGDTCSYWATLPQGKYYLAATFQDLKEIADLYGDPNSSPMRLSDNIIWHNPGPDCCHCQNLGPKKLQKRRGIGKHSEFAQVLLPGISSEKYRRAGPFKAFVFGHNLNFPWRWGDRGDPAPAQTLDPGPSVEVLSDTPSSVGLESSASASTFSPNVSEITGTSSEQLSEELLSGSIQEASRALMSDEDEEGSVAEAAGTSLPHRFDIHDNSTFITKHGQPNLRHEHRKLAR